MRPCSLALKTLILVLSKGRGDQLGAGSESMRERWQAFEKLASPSAGRGAAAYFRLQVNQLRGGLQVMNHRNVLESQELRALRQPNESVCES